MLRLDRGINRISSKQIIVALVCLVVLCVSVLLLIWLHIVYWPVPELKRQLVYAVRDELHLIDCGSIDRIYTLTSISGRPADVITVAVTSTRLCYWSADDAALCVLSSENESPKWYVMPEGIADLNSRVERITMGADHVFLNMRDASWAQSVIVLDLHDAEWRRMAGVSAIRVDPNGSGTAILLVNDQFALAQVSNIENAAYLCQAGELFDWDYDFLRNSLYIVRSAQLEIISGSGDSQVIEMSWQGLGIFVQQSLREAWVLGHGSFGLPRVAVFSDTGKMLGALRTIPILASPQAIDQRSCVLIREQLTPVVN